MTNTQPSNKPAIVDHSFSALMLGVVIGAAGAFLLGTTEGKKILQKAIDSLPDNLKKMDNQLGSKTNTHPNHNDDSLSDNHFGELSPPQFL